MTRADKKFNFAACLTDAVGWPLGGALFSNTTILPLFLKHLGASNTAIGCLPALYNLLMFLPGFLVVGYLNRLPRARGYLFTVALIERFALLGLVPLTLLWGRTHPGWLIAALFGAITVHAGAMGSISRPTGWSSENVFHLHGGGDYSAMQAASPACAAWAWTACCAVCCPARTAAFHRATRFAF